MSTFWSAWVIVLAVVTFGISFLLRGAAGRIPVQADGTTSHVWDGVRENLRRLPPWWISGVLCQPRGCPRLPRALSRARRFRRHAGLDFARTTSRTTPLPIRAKLDARIAPWRGLTIEQMAKDRNAVATGGRLYQDNCAACHGKGAHGNSQVGAPDLTDDVWQFGGSGDAILTSILNGRSAVMPPWGKALQREGVTGSGGVRPEPGWPFQPRMAGQGRGRSNTRCSACPAMAAAVSGVRDGRARASTDARLALRRRLGGHHDQHPRRPHRRHARVARTPGRRPDPA